MNLDTKQTKIEIVNEAMNYLNFTLFYQELDVISKVLAETLANNHNIDGLTNEFLLKLLITEGRYYYIHNEFDAAQQVFQKALKIARN